MKHIILATATSILLLTACNSGNNPSKSGNDTTQTAPATTSTAPVPVENQSATPVKEIVNGYLQMKNALAGDDDKGAAKAGDAMVTAFQQFDKSALPADKKKVYEDIEDDAREHAEHIGKNAGNIKHQREHFDMLSKDIYELVKTFGGGQPLYYDHCPMYNNNKGADWISETKAIANPYLGQEMPTCGTVKEELK